MIFKNLLALLVLLVASITVGALPTVPVSNENDPFKAKETPYEVDLYETDQVEFDDEIVNDQFFGTLFDAPKEKEPKVRKGFDNPPPPLIYTSPSLRIRETILLSDDEGSNYNILDAYGNQPNPEDEYTAFPLCELCAPEMGIDSKELCRIKKSIPLTEDCQFDLAEGDMAGVRGSNVAKFVEELNRVMAAPPCSVEEDPSCQNLAARRTPYSKWNNGVVPYEFTTTIPSKNRKKIRAALDEIEDVTCIKFVPRKKHRFWIKIVALNGGCTSFVGRTPLQYQPQVMSLDAGCMQKGRIQHEFMHALGFYHEQTRSDRDEYVKVLKDNIDPDFKHNFGKYEQSMITHLGTKYDYKSVMHYRDKAFTVNGRETIVPIRNGRYVDVKIGQREGVSETDILEINKLYNCPLDKNNKIIKRKKKMKIHHKLGAGCEDLNDWCSVWARKHSNCDKFQYMKKHCRLSCMKCKPNDL